MRVIFRLFTVLFILCMQVQPLVAAELIKAYPGVDVSEYRLENGLKVLMKDNAFDEGEVFVKIYFDGGYSQEASIKDKVSAFVSFLALQETTLMGGARSSNKPVKWDEPFDELVMYVHPTSRGIEARVPTHYFDEFTAYLSEIFQNPQISDEAYSKVINSISEKNKNSLAKNKYHTLAKIYEVFFEGSHFSPESVGQAIHQSDKQAAQKFLNKTFSENTPFTIVVVGDIDSKKVIRALEKHLPKKEYSKQPVEQKLKPVAMAGAKNCLLKGSDDKESVSTVIYSLKMEGSGKELALFHTTLSIIEKRLRESLSSNVGRKGFRISSEFPFYPDVTLSLVQIKFNVPSHLNSSLLKGIQNQINDLVKNGPTQEEFNEVINSLTRGGALLSNDNYFWLSLISDYEISGWDLTHISSRIKPDANLTPQVIQEYMKRTLVMNDPVNIFQE